MNEVYKLREENERRGEVISSYINEIAKEKLLRLIDNSKIQERKELNDNLKKISEHLIMKYRILMV